MKNIRQNGWCLHQDLKKRPQTPRMRGTSGDMQRLRPVPVTLKLQGTLTRGIQGGRVPQIYLPTSETYYTHLFA